MKKKILVRLCFAAGLLLCAYPLVSSLLGHYRQQQVISTYETAVEQVTDIERVLAEAAGYNEMLAQTNGAIVGNLQETVLSSENYSRLLNVTDTGIMGTLEIPKIKSELPIYHGTEEEILKNGVGHLEGTALPIGGESTRCVLTGHRGLPNSKLFTRLDELEKGDLFFLTVCNQTLAYRICEIEVIEPEEVEALDPKKGKDMVSLITCTPYGLNTHRLIVTGERTAYHEAERQSLAPVLPSLRELVFAALPFVFLAVIILPKITSRNLNE